MTHDVSTLIRQERRSLADLLGWSHGDGPDVAASSSALVRALTGRPVRRQELSGAGADMLFRRLSTRSG